MNQIVLSHDTNIRKENDLIKKKPTITFHLRHFTERNNRKKKYLNNPITGCKAPAARTSFFMFGDECTKFPMTPT